MKLTPRSLKFSLRTLVWILLGISSMAWQAFMPLVGVIQNYLKTNNLPEKQKVVVFNVRRVK
jgi:hypothetical protein